MFTNGVPYTYQNGMAIFHSPDGGYQIPQAQVRQTSQHFLFAVKSCISLVYTHTVITTGFTFASFCKFLEVLPAVYSLLSEFK